MSQNSCCVPGCLVTKKHGIPFHCFPNPDVNAEKFNTWVVKIGGEIAVLDNLVVYSNRRVCHKHFEDIDKYPSNRLCKLAIPALYLPEQLHTESVTLPSLPSTSGIQNIKSDIRQRDQLFTEPVTMPAPCSISGVQETQTAFQMKEHLRTESVSLPAVPSTPGVQKTQSNMPMGGATTPSTRKKLYVCDDTVPTASKAPLASLSAPGTSRATGPTINITQTQNSSGVENTDTDIRDDNDDADDDSDTLVESNVCRVCLALDVKMYDFKDIELREMFQNITGIAVTENNHPILERLCWECAGRLKAAAVFRNQALLSDALLQGLASTGGKIRKNDITLIKENEDYLKSVESSSAVEVFHIVDIDPENDSEPPITENNDTEKGQKTVRNDSIKLKIDSIIKEDNGQMDAEAPFATEMEFDQFDHICHNIGEESSNNVLETNPVVTNNVPFREDKINSVNSSPLPSCAHVEPKYPILNYLIKTPSDSKDKIKKPMIRITKRDSITKLVSKNSIEVISVLKGDAKLKNIYVKIGGISKKTSKLKLVKKTQVKASKSEFGRF